MLISCLRSTLQYSILACYMVPLPSTVSPLIWKPTGQTGQIIHWPTSSTILYYFAWHSGDTSSYLTEFTFPRCSGFNSSKNKFLIWFYNRYAACWVMIGIRILVDSEISHTVSKAHTSMLTPCNVWCVASCQLSLPGQRRTLHLMLLVLLIWQLDQQDATCIWEGEE